MKQTHPAIISAIQARILKDLGIEVNIKFASGLWDVARFTCPKIKTLQAQLLGRSLNEQSANQQQCTTSSIGYAELVETAFEMMKHQHLNSSKTAKVVEMMISASTDSVEVLL